MKAYVLAYNKAYFHERRESKENLTCGSCGRAKTAYGPSARVSAMTAREPGAPPITSSGSAGLNATGAAAPAPTWCKGGQGL